MIRSRTFLYLLKTGGYQFEVIAGRVIKISHERTNEIAFFPLRRYYSWLGIRIMMYLNADVFIFPPKVEVLKWKLRLAIENHLKSIRKK